MLPTLTPRGRGTSYASALEALRQTIPSDVALLKADGYQVHRPSVFFLTDGQPTEKDARWQAALEALKDPAFKERPNILAFGVGEAEPDVIGPLASTPGFAFMMAEGVSTAGAIAEFATSMLNSMVSSAERLDRGEQTIEFEKPEGFVAARRALAVTIGCGHGWRRCGARGAGRVADGPAAPSTRPPRVRDAAATPLAARPGAGDDRRAGRRHRAAAGRL